MAPLIMAIGLSGLSPTDRPDMTESVSTVPVGNLQVETEMIGVDVGRQKKISIDNAVFLNTLIKTGLFNKVDVHLGCTGIRTSQFQLRIRYSGSFGKGAGFAIMPAFTYDVGSSTQMWSIFLPLSYQVSDLLSVAGMYNINVSSDVSHFGSLSFSVSPPFDGNISFFIETAIDVLDKATKQWYINSGFVWQVNDGMQLDLGTYYNLYTGNIYAFLGFSIAFWLKHKSSE